MQSDDERNRADLSANCLIMVPRIQELTSRFIANEVSGVDALNTTLEVLLFAAATNMGQGWKTVLTLFACKLHLSVPYIPRLPARAP